MTVNTTIPNIFQDYIFIFNRRSGLCFKLLQDNSASLGETLYEFAVTELIVSQFVLSCFIPFLFLVFINDMISIKILQEANITMTMIPEVPRNTLLCLSSNTLINFLRCLDREDLSTNRYKKLP